MSETPTLEQRVAELEATAETQGAVLDSLLADILPALKEMTGLLEKVGETGHAVRDPMSQLAEMVRSMS